MFEEIKAAFRRFSSLTVKYSLLMFNLILLLSGITLLCLGIVIKEVYKEYEPIVDNAYISASTLLIVSGSLLFVFAFFGCCGAYLESHWMLIIYSVLIGLIFIMEVAAGITGYALSDKPDTILISALNHSLHENTTTMHAFWDKIQGKLGCCGVFNSSDYENTTLPLSCCSDTTISICTANSSSINHVGCNEKIKEIISGNAMTIGTGALSVILLQLVGMFCAICLAKSIENAYEHF